MALQQLFYCFCLQTVSNFAVAAVYYLLREVGWLLDYSNDAPDPPRRWWEPCAPQIRSRHLCSSEEGGPWHWQTGLPSPPMLFCSPAHEVISMLFRAGTVNPCDLSHCGIALLSVLCLKAQGKKKSFVCLVTGALCISSWAFQFIFFSVQPVENFSPPAQLWLLILQQVPVTCCVGSCCNPLLQPQDLLCQVLALSSTSVLSK